MKKYIAYCIIPGVLKETIKHIEVYANDVNEALAKAQEECHRQGGYIHSIMEVGK